MQDMWMEKESKRKEGYHSRDGDEDGVRVGGAPQPREVRKQSNTEDAPAYRRFLCASPSRAENSV